jgi:hypothetical protein
MDETEQLELRRQRAVAHLGMYERVLRTLAARVAFCKEIVAAAGSDWETFQQIPLSRFEEREVIIRRGRKAMRKAGLL